MYYGKWKAKGKNAANVCAEILMHVVNISWQIDRPTYFDIAVSLVRHRLLKVSSIV